MRKKSVVSHSHTFFFLFIIVAFFLGTCISFLVNRVIAQVTNNTIYACVAVGNGNVRIVGQGEPCRNKEFPVSWNVQGPAGPPGGSGNNIRLITSGTNYSIDYYGFWQGKDLSGSQLLDSDFQPEGEPGPEYNMTNVKFDNSSFTRSGFQKNVNLSNSTFVNVRFKEARFRGFDTTRVNATNTNFTNAIIESTLFEIVDLTGATGFSTATLTDVTWANTICPDGTNSDSNGNTCVGHF